MVPEQQLRLQVPRPLPALGVSAAELHPTNRYLNSIDVPKLLYHSRLSDDCFESLLSSMTYVTTEIQTSLANTVSAARALCQSSKLPSIPSFVGCLDATETRLVRLNGH